MNTRKTLWQKDKLAAASIPRDYNQSTLALQIEAKCNV